jgi:hypothetical protein
MGEIKTEKIVGDNGGIIITETDENGRLIFYSQFDREDCECLKNH